MRGDAEADLYLARGVAEHFELSSIVREHISDLTLADLTEELHRRGRAGKDASRMVGEVQHHWANERGWVLRVRVPRLTDGIGAERKKGAR